MALPAAVVFLRYPEEGTTKTRLADGSSPGEAANLYRCMVEVVIDSLLPGAGVDYELWVYFTPIHRKADLLDWLFPVQVPSGVRFVAQPDDAGLAERLERAGEAALESGAPAVLFVGTDCLEMTREDLVEAIRLLDEHPAAIGPSVDGGFWLLAVRRFEQGLFQGIPYSSDRTGRLMQERLRQRGTPAALLPIRRDIDTVADLEAQPRRVRETLAERARKSGLAIPPQALR